jgi:hypothetical protein
MPSRLEEGIFLRGRLSTARDGLPDARIPECPTPPVRISGKLDGGCGDAQKNP